MVEISHRVIVTEPLDVLSHCLGLLESRRRGCLGLVESRRRGPDASGRHRGLRLTAPVRMREGVAAAAGLPGKQGSTLLSVAGLRASWVDYVYYSTLGPLLCTKSSTQGMPASPAAPRRWQDSPRHRPGLRKCRAGAAGRVERAGWRPKRGRYVWRGRNV